MLRTSPALIGIATIVILAVVPKAYEWHAAIVGVVFLLVEDAIEKRARG